MNAKGWESLFISGIVMGVLAWAALVLCVALIFKGFIFWLVSPK